MHKLFKTLVLGAGLALASVASATVINGTIRNIDGDGDGKADDRRVSRLTFTVSAGTRIFFDSLVIEAAGKDLNGDGHITGFDSIMRLYKGSTELAYVDDSSQTFGDGSISSWDAAFEYNFDTAGTYMLAIGQRSFYAVDALRGYVTDWNYLPLVGNENWGAWRLTMNIKSGAVSDLRLLDVDPAAGVPEPATLALLGAGLLGIACGRRRHPR